MIDRLTELETMFDNFRIEVMSEPTGDASAGFPTPVPPPSPTGACCDGEDCSITTEEACEGEYQGDGTDCDPNPCIVGCCPDYFEAFDDSGRKFLTLTGTVSDTPITCIPGVCYTATDNCT